MGVQPPNFAVSPFYIQQVAAAASFQQQPQYWQQPHPQSQVNFFFLFNACTINETYT